MPAFHYLSPTFGRKKGGWGEKANTEEESSQYIEIWQCLSSSMCSYVQSKLQHLYFKRMHLLTRIVYFSEREMGETYLQLLKWYFCVSKLRGTNWPQEKLKEEGRFTHGILCFSVTLVRPPPKAAL